MFVDVSDDRESACQSRENRKTRKVDNVSHNTESKSEHQQRVQTFVCDSCRHSRAASGPEYIS